MSHRAMLGMSDEHRRRRLDHIGGSDARILMSGLPSEVEHLWRVKRREVEDESCDDALLVQLGNATEALNTAWFERQTDLVVTDTQRFVIDPDWPVASCTLDGIVRSSADADPMGVFEAKFMMPFGWSMREAIEKYAPQCQHNMMVTRTDRSWLSVITGAGQWQAAEIRRDEFYVAAMLHEEREFWWRVKVGRRPTPGALIPIKPDRIRSVVMDDADWRRHAAELLAARPAVDRYERARRALKRLVPPDAVRADGHGVVASLSKAGTIKVSINDGGGCG